jgi:hypothetical protein
MVVMALDLFAGIPVRNSATALAWCERLLGYPPAFFPNDTEAVWELAEHTHETYADGNEIGFGGGPVR